MCGGILELLQGGVDLQCFCKGSCALRANVVPVETGGGEGDKSSAGVNALEIMWRLEGPDAWSKVIVSKAGKRDQARAGCRVLT